MYQTFMLPVDAIDNGIEISDTCRYRDPTDLSSRVKRLNPRWNETSSAPSSSSSSPAQQQRDDENARFEIASAMCGDDFAAILEYVVECDLDARGHVEAAIVERKAGEDVLEEIITLPDGGVPWKTHLYDLEVKHCIEGLIKFVLYTDQSGMWRVQAVTVKGTAFTNRVGIIAEWRGMRDAELEKICGIKGAKFVHASGFIGGCETLEGAVEMAVLSIKRDRIEAKEKDK
jgi:uncharacterized UPF0160 family protein